MQLAERRLLFVTDPANVASAGAPGGVQLCTTEYRALLQAAGFTVTDFPIDHDRGLAQRTKVRLGLDTYDRYDLRGALALDAAVRAQGSPWVAVNQVNLLPLAVATKARLGAAVRVIALSHGSESGDVLHEVSRLGAGWRRSLADWRLGRMVAEEGRLFREGVDLLLTLSDTDAEIARWQGAARTLVVPRTWTAATARAVRPDGTIGFLGSLHHKPNWDGLCALLEATGKLPLGDVRVRVVGGPEARGREIAARFGFVDYLGPLSDAMLVEEVASWSVFVNPVFWHARGASIKLATAISWGMPVVSSRAGARGYRGVDDAVLWADDASAMARGALRIATDALARESAATAIVALSRRSPQLCAIAAELREALTALEVT